MNETTPAMRFWQQYSRRFKTLGTLRIILAVLVLILACAYLINGISSVSSLFGSSIFSGMGSSIGAMSGSAMVLVLVPFALVAGMGIAWAIFFNRAAKDEKHLSSLRLPSAASLTLSLTASMLLFAGGGIFLSMADYYRRMTSMMSSFSSLFSSFGSSSSLSDLLDSYSSYGSGSLGIDDIMVTVYIVYGVLFLVASLVTLLTCIARTMCYRSIGICSGSDAASVKGTGFYTAMKIISSIFKILGSVILLISAISSGSTMAQMYGSGLQAASGIINYILIILIAAMSAATGIYEASLIIKFKSSVILPPMPMPPYGETPYPNGYAPAPDFAYANPYGAPPAPYPPQAPADFRSPYPPAQQQPFTTPYPPFPMQAYTPDAKPYEGAAPAPQPAPAPQQAVAPQEAPLPQPLAAEPETPFAEPVQDAPDPLSLNQ